MVLEVGGGVVWFNVCICIRVDGKYGVPGVAFGVHVVYRGVVDEFVAF